MKQKSMILVHNVQILTVHLDNSTCKQRIQDQVTLPGCVAKGM